MNLNPSAELFLNSLCGKPVSRPSLFEPFLPRKLAEQLIWRRGNQLWDTPEHYTETMISLRERTLADVVFLDTRPYRTTDVSGMLQTAEAILPENSALVILCCEESVQRLSEQSDRVCAVGGFGSVSPGKKPFIRMDGTPDLACREGATGFFASDDGFSVWQEYHGKIAVCGGLGAKFCSTASPVGMHSTIETLANDTRNAGFLPGSGGCIAESAYLEMISLLGGLIRLRP